MFCLTHGHSAHEIHRRAQPSLQVQPAGLGDLRHREESPREIGPKRRDRPKDIPILRHSALSQVLQTDLAICQKLLRKGERIQGSAWNRRVAPAGRG